MMTKLIQLVKAEGCKMTGKYNKDGTKFIIRIFKEGLIILTFQDASIEKAISIAEGWFERSDKYFNTDRVLKKLKRSYGLIKKDNGLEKLLEMIQTTYDSMEPGEPRHDVLKTVLVFGVKLLKKERGE